MKATLSCMVICIICGEVIYPGDDIHTYFIENKNWPYLVHSECFERYIDHALSNPFNLIP